MALNVKELIEKLEKVENKLGYVYLETPDLIFTVDRVILDQYEDITLVNNSESDHCDCERCKEVETEF